jgi:hypothetical protein
LLSQYKSLFQNAEFVKLIVGFGIGLGVFNALLTERLPLARSAHCTACAVQPPCRVASASTQTRPGSNTQHCNAAMCAIMRHRIATRTQPRATCHAQATRSDVQRATYNTPSASVRQACAAALRRTRAIIADVVGTVYYTPHEANATTLNATNWTQCVLHTAAGPTGAHANQR